MGEHNRGEAGGKAAHEIRLYGIILLLTMAALAQPAFAAVGGGGSVQIPCFTVNRTGGTGGTTVVFNPSCTYLPVSTTPGQTYIYQAAWFFGDVFSGSQLANPQPAGLAIGPDEVAANILIPVSHVYTGDAQFYAQLRIDTLIRDEINFTSGAINNPAGEPLGDTLLSVDGFAAPIPNNYYVAIAGESDFAATPQRLVFHRVVSSTNGATGLPQTITLASALTAAVADNAVIRLYTVTSGPSVFSEFQPIRTAIVNYPPLPSIRRESSDPDGTLPYALQINVSASHDQDGYILWSAIDWGDGSCSLVTQAQLTPAEPNAPLDRQPAVRHSYTSAGVFNITIFTIDNGRFDVLANMAALNTFVSGIACDNPDAALAQIVAFHNTTYKLTTGNTVQPIMSRDFISIEIPGNAVASKGTFKVDFVKKFKDTFDVSMRPNVFLENIANARVVVTLGSGTSQLTLPAFTTDKRGKFDNKEGFAISIDGRKQLVRLRFTKSDLTGPLKLKINESIINGFVDVPVRVVVNDIYTLATTVRFVYNSEAGIRALGSKGRSLQAGN